VGNARADHERDRHQPEKGDASLQEAEGSLPEQGPHHQSGRHGPPPGRYPRDELQRQTEPADLGREDQAVDQQAQDQRQDEEVGAETLAHGPPDGVLAHGRETARHLDQEDRAHGAERDHPQMPKAEERPGLAGRGDHPDIEESADAGDDPERDLERLVALHELPGRQSLECESCRAGPQGRALTHGPLSRPCLRRYQ
jgi:hypothetical protein